MKNNNKNIKRICILALLVMFSLALSLPVFSQDMLSVGVPVTVENVPCTVLWTAIDGAPLPESDSQTFVGTKEFVVSFTEPGVYRYEARQVPPSANDGCTYDSTVYHITVNVFVDGYDELYANTVVSLADSNYKPAQLMFTNEKPVPSPTEPDTSQPDTTQPEKPSNTEKVNTGDSENPLLLLVLAVAAFMTLVFTRRKKSQAQTD